jgi:hypothetical protein
VKRRQRWGSRHKWEDSFRVDVEHVACEGVNWILVADDKAQCYALVSTAMNVLIS